MTLESQLALQPSYCLNGQLLPRVRPPARAVSYELDFNELRSLQHLKSDDASPTTAREKLNSVDVPAHLRLISAFSALCCSVLIRMLELDPR